VTATETYDMKTVNCVRQQLFVGMYVMKSYVYEINKL